MASHPAPPAHLTLSACLSSHTAPYPAHTCLPSPTYTQHTHTHLPCHHTRTTTHTHHLPPPGFGLPLPFAWNSGDTRRRKRTVSASTPPACQPTDAAHLPPSCTQTVRQFYNMSVLTRTGRAATPAACNRHAWKEGGWRTCLPTGGASGEKKKYDADDDIIRTSGIEAGLQHATHLPTWQMGWNGSSQFRYLLPSAHLPTHHTHRTLFIRAHHLPLYRFRTHYCALKAHTPCAPHTHTFCRTHTVHTSTPRTTRARCCAWRTTRTLPLLHIHAPLTCLPLQHVYSPAARTLPDTRTLPRTRALHGLLPH